MTYLDKTEMRNYITTIPMDGETHSQNGYLLSHVCFDLY